MHFPVIFNISSQHASISTLKYKTECLNNGSESMVPRPVAAAAGNSLEMYWGGFPGGAVVENLPANAGDTGSSPGLGRSHMPRSN